MKYTKNDIGDAIRKARTARDWTQQELAHEAGVAPAYVSMVESGERTNTTMKTLDKLLAALELRIAIVPRVDTVVCHSVAPATLVHVDALVERGLHGVGREGVVESLMLAGLREALVPR